MAVAYPSNPRQAGLIVPITGDKRTANINGPPEGWIYSDPLGWLPPEEMPPPPPGSPEQEINPKPLPWDYKDLLLIEQAIEAFLAENPPEPPRENQQNPTRQP